MPETSRRMQQSHKTAIARILSDLIKADRIVDTGEMKCWREVCEKYSIDREARVKAREMSFADALRVICETGVAGLREDLLGDCRAMTVSDGFCAHSEAMLMLALTTVLGNDDTLQCDVFSIPRASFNIDSATALYIESDFDPETNEIIQSQYRTIFKELQLAGFHFVYIPRIIHHYLHTDRELFMDILSFLAPNLSDTKLEEAYEAIISMDTKRFCRDLLVNKCGIADLHDTPPALLIKIGNSYVGDEPYANYLRVEVDDEIVTTVQGVLDIFTGMLSSDKVVISTSEESENQFHFHGFYKQLLDIFLVQRNIRSEVLIDTIHEEILFPGIETKATGLHRRERALYALMLCQGSTGVRFDSPKTKSDKDRYERNMARTQSRYEAIYEILGGDAKQVPDLSSPEIRRPIIACLRRSLKRLDALYNPEDYNVTKTPNGRFAVNVDPTLIYVREPGNATPVPLKDSLLYHRFTNP